MSVVDIQGLVFWANLVCAVGIGGTMLGHSVIATRPRNQKHGFFISGVGASITACGAFLLSSWPMFALDAVWATLSFQAATGSRLYFPDRLIHVAIWTIPGAIGGAFVLVLAGSPSNPMPWDNAAFCTTAVYILAYVLYTHGCCTREYYLLTTLLAAPFLFPHLYVVSGVSIGVNELIGMAMRFWGLWAVRRDWRGWFRAPARAHTAASDMGQSPRPP